MAMTPAEKQAAYRERKRIAEGKERRSPAEHGTISGYQKHRRSDDWSDEACGPCKAAWANYYTPRRLMTNGALCSDLYVKGHTQAYVVPNLASFWACWPYDPTTKWCVAFNDGSSVLFDSKEECLAACAARQWSQCS